MVTVVVELCNADRHPRTHTHSGASASSRKCGADQTHSNTHTRQQHSAAKHACERFLSATLFAPSCTRFSPRRGLVAASCVRDECALSLSSPTHTHTHTLRSLCSSAGRPKGDSFWCGTQPVQMLRDCSVRPVRDLSTRNIAFSISCSTVHSGLAAFSISTSELVISTTY